MLIAVFIVSLWGNREVDWGHFVTLSIGGLIGTVIGLGIKKAIEIAGSERQN